MKQRSKRSRKQLTDRADAAVRREHDDRRERALERTVQIREAFDVQHVDLDDAIGPWRNHP